jgi:nucleoside-diphosphate-sugar epimerase
MKSAFVTGGTGFIGSHLVEELLQRGYDEVRCLIRTQPRWLEGLPIRPVRGDLYDDARIEDAVRDVDVVYHNAGVTRARSWEAFRQSNVEATLRLMDIVARVNPTVERVVVTSSLAAVGRCSSGIADESSPLEPVSHYGRSKADMEQALSAYQDRVPVVIVRPSAVYGPREADIYTFFKTLSKGICPVVGDVRGPALSLVHVADLVRGMVDAAEAEGTAGETYFLGSDAFYSWHQVKQAATSALDRSALTISVPPVLLGVVGAAVEAGARLTGAYPPLNREKAREIRYTCKMCSIDKARSHFGYRTLTSLRDGVAETIAWYRNEGWL